jgi:hypothetical protein
MLNYGRLYYSTLCYVILCFDILCFASSVLLFYARQGSALLFYIRLRFVMQGYAMQCHAMLMLCQVSCAITVFCTAVLSYNVTICYWVLNLVRLCLVVLCCANAVLCNAVQCCAVLCKCSAVQCCANATQYSAILCCFVLCFAILC